MFRFHFRGKRIHSTGGMLLADLQDGRKGIITGMLGGKHSTKRLADLGLAPGTEVEMISSSFSSGPVQIKVCGSRLVIGRGLASRIFIEQE